MERNRDGANLRVVFEPTEELNGKVALVTGAGSGIGQATALEFASRGARVVVSDVSSDGLAKTAGTILDRGGDALSVVADVSVRQDVDRLVSEAVSSFGRLDFAFNNAGIEGDSADTSSCTEENWDRVIDVNLKGVWLCMRAEIPVMREQGEGVIVNNASVAGLVGFRDLPAYCASKGGVVELSRATALECATSRIRVNSVCPGVIRTPMVERVFEGDPEAAAAIAAMEPVGRIGTPEEIASAVLWLCSPGAGFVTGHALVVDGGLTAQ